MNLSEASVAKMEEKGSRPFKTIGIPRALLYYRYGLLWEGFFKNLGFEVVLSDATDRAMVEAGDALSVDECCLASKVFMGHVASLVGKADAIFIPSFGNGDPRAGFCTKFQAQQDLVRNTFPPEELTIISPRIENITEKKAARKGFEDIAAILGVPRKSALEAAKRAWAVYSEDRKRKAAAQKKTLRLLEEFRKVVAKDPTGKEQAPLAILLVAHPYIAHDPYLCGAIVDGLKAADATVIFADETNREAALKKSFEFSRTLPWIVNRELIGSILLLRDQIDGIVLVSAFPCGPDSMTDDAIMRTIQGVPILNLMIDAQSGTAGVETRIESFTDILRFQRQGGYVSERS